MIRAVLFDLDGTLLLHDFDRDFMPRYVRLVVERCTEAFGAPDVPAAFMSSVARMLANDGGATNYDRFGHDFAARLGVNLGALVELFDDLYARDFPALRADAVGDPDARATIAACRERGAATVLATNPVFPRTAIEQRLRWAGLTAEQFDLLTTAETATACKPSPDYYRQIVERVGVAPEDCLVVGNDVEMDLESAATLGMTTCLVDNDFRKAGSGPFAPTFVLPLRDVAALVG